MIKDIVKDAISKLYYALKAGNTWALFGPEAGRFGYTCLLCGRQYKQLARHVASDHKYPRVRSTDVATTFAFPEDIDDALEEILAVPAARRQVLKSCKRCTESFVCKCRLGQVNINVKMNESTYLFQRAMYWSNISTILDWSSWTS